MSFIKPTSTKPFSMTHENMMRAVIGFTLNPVNVVTTNSVPAFATQINVVNTNLITIDGLRASIAPSITGYAAQKRAAKVALASITADVMKATYSYAIDNGDVVLAEKMRTSQSDLEDMKYIELYQYTQGIIAVVTPLVPSLTNYNVTVGTMTAWQTASLQLNSFIANPRNQISNRVTVNKQIQALLRENMLILTEQTDTSAFVFRTADLNYYNNYVSSRKLIPHHMSTQLRIYVLDIDGNPVTNGEVFIIGTDRSNTLDTQGYALVDHIPFGTHQVSVATPSGTEFYGPFDFKKGKSLTLHVQIGEFASTGSATAKPSKVTVTENDVEEVTK